MPPLPVATARPRAPRLCLKTHGTRVARMHLLDWVVLVLLVGLNGALNFIEPFHRFVGEDMVPGLRYPLKDNTVPVWAVPVVVVVVLPIAIVAGIYVRRRNVYDLHHGILGLLFSVLINTVLTDAIKDGVDRPRPTSSGAAFWMDCRSGIAVLMVPGNPGPTILRWYKH